MCCYERDAVSHHRMSLWGRFDVIYDLKVSHLATVPMILYTPKASSEHFVDDCGAGGFRDSAE